MAFDEIYDSKVPLIKYKDSETGFSCDVIVNGVLGVKNSEMIKLYSEIDERFLKLGLFVKFWAKYYQILSAANGFLSSYAYQMMLLAF